jgi:hypothetical protein
MNKQNENQLREKLDRLSGTGFVVERYLNRLAAVLAEKLSQRANSAATTLDRIKTERELAGYATNATAPPTNELRDKR